jgi:hypothetical protein
MHNDRLTWLDRVLIVTMSTIALVLPIGTLPDAEAAQIESPTRTVERITVTYAEHTGTARYPNRHYFETNDGAAYRYKGYRACANAHEVAPRICRTVFWYAR